METISGVGSAVVTELLKSTRKLKRRYRLRSGKVKKIIIDLTGPAGGTHVPERLKAIARAFDQQDLWDGYVPCWAEFFGGQPPRAGSWEVSIKLDQHSFGDQFLNRDPTMERFIIGKSEDQYTILNRSTTTLRANQEVGVEQIIERYDEQGNRIHSSSYSYETVTGASSFTIIGNVPFGLSAVNQFSGNWFTNRNMVMQLIAILDRSLLQQIPGFGTYGLMYDFPESVSLHSKICDQNPKLPVCDSYIASGIFSDTECEVGHMSKDD